MEKTSVGVAESMLPGGGPTVGDGEATGVKIDRDGTALHSGGQALLNNWRPRGTIGSGVHLMDRTSTRSTCMSVMPLMINRLPTTAKVRPTHRTVFVSLPIGSFRTSRRWAQRRISEQHEALPAVLSDSGAPPLEKGPAERVAVSERSLHC